MWRPCRPRKAWALCKVTLVILHEMTLCKVTPVILHEMTLCKVTPVILHGVVSTEEEKHVLMFS